MEGSRPGDGSPAARCVLWHAAGAAGAAADLEARLVGRGVEVLHATDPYGAMAELCMAARNGERAGGADRAHDCVPLSLVLISPGALPLAGELVVAARHHVPAAVVWAYDPTPSPTLRPVAESDIDAWLGASGAATPTRADVTSDISTVPAARVGLPRAHPPRLRLTDDGAVEASRQRPDDMIGPAPNAAQDEDPAPRQLLTQEELAMLLADDEPDPPARA